MNKVESKVLIVVKGVVVGEAADWSDTVEHIEDYMSKNPEQVKDEIRLYSYIAELNSNEGHFEVTVQKGELTAGDESVGDSSEEYEIKSGDFRGEKFDDREELVAFFSQKVQSGEMTIEEVREIEVEKVMNETLYFDDVDVEDDEYQVTVSHGVASNIVDHFGHTFVLASEAEEAVYTMEWATEQKMASQKLTQEKKQTAEVMTDQEIDEEMSAIQERLFALQLEKKKRAESIPTHNLPQPVALNVTE